MKMQDEAILPELPLLLPRIRGLASPCCILLTGGDRQ
ncbi:rCG61439 [Rattus norvegicus]|uniref:RCG61439 n=1 Tax=Rattus norvegicus TaxID=10116 RepID=A6HA38_RAT|nr:rCG61439 [Rattus norvegicus]